MVLFSVLGVLFSTTPTLLYPFWVCFRETRLWPLVERRGDARIQRTRSSASSAVNLAERRVHDTF